MSSVYQEFSGGAFSIKQATPSLREVQFSTFTVGSTGCDYTTIQAALDAMGAEGGTIWLMDPSYQITTGLLVKSNRVEIIGKANGTRIYCDGSSVTTLIKANSTTYQGFALRNVWLDQTNATIQGIAIDASNMSLCIYENVRILSFGTAIKIDDTANNTFYNMFRDIKIFECNNGIDITSTNPVNDNQFENIRIALKAGGAGTGLKITNGQGNLFVNLNAEPGTGTGITGVSLTTANTMDTCFVNSYFENNATNVSIGSGVLRTTFIGGTNTLAGTTNLSDSGTDTAFVNTRLAAALKNQFSPTTFKDNGNSSSVAGYFVNNTSFAHVGSALGRFELVNATDSSVVLDLINAGTGNYITASTNFTVTKGGVVTASGGFTNSGGRNLDRQGADVASAGNLTLGSDGNVFEITGTTTINAITTAGWQTGAIITLVFAASLTVSHNTAGGGGTAVILLAGAVNFSATAGDTLTLRYSEQGGTNAWREVSRAVI
jgi:hypothetical protein